MVITMTMQEIWQWGINLILLLQSYDGWLRPMQLITFTGSTEFFLLILPVLYWLVNRRLGVRMATILLFAIAVGSILKIAGHGPRPYWIDARIQLLTGEEPTFGLPSIHAINSVVMWPLLAHYIGRLWAWLLALILIAFAGIARVYLGVHFPSDVIAGWLLGLFFVMLWWRWAEPIGVWFSARSSFQQRMIATIFSIALILLAAVLRLLTIMRWDLTADWPNRWPQETGRLFLAFSIADIVTVVGVFAGMVSGLLLSQSQGSFLTTGRPLHLLGRYLIGVVGVLILWQGLDLLFPPFAAEESTFGYALRYIRYSFIGVWIFGVAPLLFVKLRLAQRAC